jgi:TrpR family transcriptional regulator, trp operon repressor
MTPRDADLLRALCAVQDPDEMRRVLADLLSRSEYAALQKRWTILRLLRLKVPQRQIARQIGGSLCNVTRGARLLRSPDCASARLMDRLDKETQEPLAKPLSELLQESSQ